MRHRTRRAQRGLTFLEVIMSLAMVGVVGAMITGGIGFMERAQRANALRLDAVEVAHRVIIQQVDDDKLWKQEVNRVELNGTVFEFDLHLEVLVSDGSSTDPRARRERREVNASTFNERLTSKLHLVTAQVWAVDPPQESGEPLATLTRVYNILDVEGDALFGRIIRMQEEDMQRQIDQLKAERDGGAAPGGGGGGGGRGGGSVAPGSGEAAAPRGGGGR
ncbi:MAG: type II secretion system protein [Phycisphaerales bacterium]